MYGTRAAAKIRRLAAYSATGARFWIALSATAMAAFALVAILLGADANWDLKNYHLYAALGGGIDIDHNPAGVQGYLNPTLDLLLTRPLVEHGNLLLLSAVLGGVQGLNFVLLAGIAGAVLHGEGQRAPLAALAAALGVTGAIAVAEIGTTFGDLTTAVLVLAALLGCLRAMPEGGQAPAGHLLVWSGLAIGLATGLKLTNAVYLLGLLGAVVLVGGTKRIRAGSLLGVSAFCGILLAHGWWSWQLWQAFGNPVFPLFNGVFHSPFYAPTSLSDDRFKPRGWIERLLYPFFFSWSHQTAEVPFRDFRFPVAWLLAAALLGATLVARPVRAAAGRRQFTLLAAFVVSSYVLWQWMFSIQRYAVALELLLPTFALLALLRLSARHGRKLFVAVALMLLSTTIPGNWGRLDTRSALQPIIADDLRRELVSVLEGSAVVLGPPPLAYLAAALRGADIVWFGDVYTPADAQLAARKLAGRKRIFTISRAAPADIQSVNARLANLGLPEIDGTACRQVATALDVGLLLCGVRRGVASPAQSQP